MGKCISVGQAVRLFAPASREAGVPPAPGALGRTTGTTVLMYAPYPDGGACPFSSCRQMLYTDQ
jgi:hypothetical protein